MNFLTRTIPSARIILLASIQSAAKILDNLRYSVSKNSYLIQFYEINICQIMIFWLNTVYNKLEMIKIDNQTREKSQVLEQVLE